jgi:hypothetical protein
MIDNRNILFNDMQEKSLYRAVRDAEWKQILRDGNFIIRERDNMEQDLGPQVAGYAKEEGYAGVVIRFPVTGPFYNPCAGFQVPRVACCLAHYVNGQEIEVSDDLGKTFKPLRNFSDEA